VNVVVIKMVTAVYNKMAFIVCMFMTATTVWLIWCDI
jgi:hypothetical protein